MFREEASTILQAEKTTRHLATTVAFLCAIILLLLLPVHVYFFAFTRDTTPWLQWMLYGLLSLLGVIGIIGLVPWRRSDPLSMWRIGMMGKAFPQHGSQGGDGRDGRLWKADGRRMFGYGPPHLQNRKTFMS